jgi:hypothetical protein
MTARLHSVLAIIVMAVSVPSLLSAQEPAVRPSSKIFTDIFAEAEKPKPKSASEKFGEAAAACAAALGPTSMDVTKLEPLGWSPTIKASSPKSVWKFEQKSNAVKVFLATTFLPSGQCVVDGYANSKGEFGKISKAVEKQIGVTLGKKPKTTGSSVSPDGFSRGQGFRADDLLISISSENQAGGMNIRVTMMQMDKTKSAFETANAAGMAAQYLPMLAEETEPTVKSETSPSNSTK